MQSKPHKTVIKTESRSQKVRFFSKKSGESKSKK